MIPVYWKCILWINILNEDDQVDTETHVKVHIPTDDQWKSAMETTIAGLGDSMKKITESLQSLSNTGSTGRKRKAKTAPPKEPKKKKVTSKKTKGVDSTVPKVPIDTEKDSQVQSPVKDLLRAHGFSLDSIFKDVEEYASDVRAPPVDKIPKTHSSVGGESVSSRVSIIESDDGEHDFDEDLGRGEKRKMYLQGLRNLVPELKHAPIDQELASGHFSLLQTREKGDKKPFLGELFQQVSKSVKKQNNTRDMVKKIFTQQHNQQRVDYCNHGSFLRNSDNLLQ